MKPKEILSKVRSWGDQLGVLPININAPPNIDFVLNISSNDLKDMEFSEIDEVLLKISSYSLYLSAQASALSSRIMVLESDFNQKVNTATEKMLHQKSYKTFSERYALAIRTSAELQKLQTKLVGLKAKLRLIEKLPQAIDNKLWSLRAMYKRKVNEARTQ